MNVADFTPDAFGIRTVKPDYTSHGGFQWPKEVGSLVGAPDWDPTPKCGYGLHFLADGIGDYGLLELADPKAVWMVVGYLRAEAVALGDDKSKAPRVKLVYAGSKCGALTFISREWKRIATAASEKAEGPYAPAATTGPYAPAATTGNCAPAATTGDRAPAATTGNRAPAATTGNRAPAATTGYYAPAATTGEGAPAATTGEGAPAATTGPYAPAATTGPYAPAATTGNRAPAATTGYYAPAATTGNCAPAATTGKNSVAASIGWLGRAKAAAGGAIMLAAFDNNGNLKHVFASKVGENGVEPDTWYRLGLDGQLVKLRNGEDIR